MRPPDPSAIDTPFPGAHSQVPGRRAEGTALATQRGAAALPLGAAAVASERGWVVRLPVRAEYIQVAKQVVTYERVLVRRHELDDVRRIDASVRREQVKLQVAGDAEVVSAVPHDGEHRTEIGTT